MLLTHQVPPWPIEPDDSNDFLIRPLRAGGGHSGCQLYRVMHSCFTTIPTCCQGRLRCLPWWCGRISRPPLAKPGQYRVMPCPLATCAGFPWVHRPTSVALFGFLWSSAESTAEAATEPRAWPCRLVSLQRCRRRNRRDCPRQNQLACHRRIVRSPVPVREGRSATT